MQNPVSKLIIAITGASGSIYARLIIKALGNYSAAHPNALDIALVVSDTGRKVYAYETGEDVVTYAQQCIPKVKVFDDHNFFADIASGSAGYEAMLIVPCSMGTAAKIAAALSDTLISRAAQVILKEKKLLIAAVRETPLNVLQLRALTALAEAGAVVFPACPGFYSRPESIEQLASSMVDRLLQLLGIPGDYYQWKNPE